MTASDATGPATVPDGATARFVRRPAITSSVVALAAGGVAVALVADTALQREILRLAVVGGALAFGIGARLVRHGGTALPGSGCADRARWRSRRSRRGGTGGHAVPAGHPPGRVASRDCGYVDALRGACAGPVPVESGPDRSRRRLRVPRRARDGGDTGVGTTALLLAALATIVARDAAENAVSVGGQIGGQRGARTVRAELAHVGVAASVGAGAVVVRTRGGPSRHRRPPVRRARRAHRRQRGSGPRLQSIVRARRLAGRPGTMGVQS